MQIPSKDTSLNNIVPADIAQSTDVGRGSRDGQFIGQRYKFGYKITDKYGNKQLREEETDEYNNRKGYYSFIDHDGKHRKVEYVADGRGFRATVITNEPGTAHSHPAEADIITGASNQVASEPRGGSFIEPRTILPHAMEPAAFPPQATTVIASSTIAGRASIAHVAHASAAIGVPVPHGPGLLTPAASAPPPLLVRLPHPLTKGRVMPNFKNIKSLSGPPGPGATRLDIKA